VNLEEDLRRTLSDQRVALPGWPDPVTRVRDGIRRRRRRAIIVAAIAAVAAIAIGTPTALRLAAAPSSPPAEPVPSPSVIPFVAIPTPAAATGSPSPRRTAAPCSSNQLGPPTTAWSEGAAGHLFTTIEVRNTGPRCTLARAPSLVATDKKTNRRATVPALPANYGVDSEGREYPATIDPGEGARIEIVTAMGCDGGANPAIYIDIALGYAGGEHRVAGLELETTCQIQVGRWYRELPAAPTPTPRFGTLLVSLEAPESVRAGTNATFVVVLTNPTGEPISLDPCPSYAMNFGKFSYAYGRLNCLVDQIPPHGSVRFAMVLPISTNSVDKPDHLTWGFVNESGDAPYAAAPVRLG
jgi:hypothetical protein